MSLKQIAKEAGDAIAIHYVALDDLQDSFLDGNSKKHDIDKIIDSIRRYGFRDAITFDPALNQGEGGLLEGNGRLESLIEMRSQGITPPRGVTEDWKVPIAFGVNATSEAEAVSYSIEHNWSVTWGSDVDLDQTLSLFDEDALGEQIEFLKEEESLPLSFSDDLDEILAHFDGKENDGVENGGKEEPPIPEEVESVVKRGQIWKLGRHKLACIDSTDKKLVKEFLGDRKTDLLLTDPPYGVSYTDKNKRLNAISAGNRIQTPIENDHLDSSSIFQELWLPMFGNMFAIAKEGCPYYVFSPQGGELMMMMMALQKAGWLLKHSLIWVKNNHVLGGADYHYKHEPILYGWKPGAGHYFIDSRSETSVWNFDKPLVNDLHPTMKPVSMLIYAIRNSTKKQDLVLDAFLGSGSTLIAAEQSDRICYGCELSEHYCDVVIARWESLTGEKATLERSLSD